MAENLPLHPENEGGSKEKNEKDAEKDSEKETPPKSKGIIIADTKFEFSIDECGELVLGDEILTPDSSKYWSKDEWLKAQRQRKSSEGYAKEPLRQWGMSVETPFKVTGINKLNPENPDHVAFVQSLKVPQSELKNMSARYEKIFEMLVSQELKEFQTSHIGV